MVLYKVEYCGPVFLSIHSAMDLLKRPTSIAEPFPQTIAACVDIGSSDNYKRGTCLKFKNFIHVLLSRICVVL